MKKSCIILIVGVIALSLFSCGNQEVKEAAAPQVTVMQPTIESVTTSLTYPGYTSAIQTVELVARVSGFLQSINFVEGDHVQKDQVLFVIDPKPFEDDLETANANQKVAEAQLNLAETTLQRVTEAAKSAAISELEVLQRQAERDEAAAKLSAAKAKVSIAQQNLSYCYVKAPCSGRISKKMVDLGNYVGSMGSNNVLATLYDDNPIYVYFNMEDATYLKYLKSDIEGDVFRPQNFGNILVNLGPDMPFNNNGVIDYIDPNIDLSTGTIKMRAKLKNDEGKIRSGMFVNIKLPYQVDSTALLVPEEAIGSDQSGKYIYVVNDSNYVEMRHVKMGSLTEDNKRVILSDLTQDELVIVSGLLRVRHGMKVDPKKK